MADLPGTARVAIIGEGETGASRLRHLARAGRTWHAACDAPTFPASWSTEFYRPVNYRVTESICLTHSGS